MLWATRAAEMPRIGRSGPSNSGLISGATLRPSQLQDAVGRHRSHQETVHSQSTRPELVRQQFQMTE